jgi:choline-glycine betaine transporter
MLYSAVVLTVIFVLVALSVRDSVQRMYTGKHKRFENDIMEMAIATAYLSLLVLLCVHLTEYGRAISFINSWRNLEVTEGN